MITKIELLQEATKVSEYWNNSATRLCPCYLNCISNIKLQAAQVFGNKYIITKYTKPFFTDFVQISICVLWNIWWNFQLWPCSTGLLPLERAGITEMVLCSRHFGFTISQLSIERKNVAQTLENVWSIPLSIMTNPLGERPPSGSVIHCLGFNSRKRHVRSITQGLRSVGSIEQPRIRQELIRNNGSSSTQDGTWKYLPCGSD